MLIFLLLSMLPFFLETILHFFPSINKKFYWPWTFVYVINVLITCILKGYNYTNKQKINVLHACCFCRCAWKMLVWDRNSSHFWGRSTLHPLQNPAVQTKTLHTRTQSQRTPRWLSSHTMCLSSVLQVSHKAKDPHILLYTMWKKNSYISFIHYSVFLGCM